MKTPVTIVHDVSGKIVGIVHKGDASRYSIVPQAGQFVLQLDVDEADNVPAVLHTHRVDVATRALVRNAK